MKIIALATALALFAGCSTISGNIAADAGSSSGQLGKVVQQGLLDATSNLDQAVKVGALAADDPAPACFHSVLQQLGIDPTQPALGPNASFAPKVSDLISAGSVLYIRAKQLQKLQASGITTSVPCKALIGQFMLDAAAAGVKGGVPGGGAAILFR